MGEYSLFVFILIVLATIIVAFAVLNPAVVQQFKKGLSPDPQVKQTKQPQTGAVTPPEKISYSLRRNLLTTAEVRFFQALSVAVGEEYLIFAKVRVADVLQPQTNSDRSAWQRAFNKISAKHFDFVLCDKETLQLKCAIELDDSSHSQGHRAKRDTFLNEAAQSADLAMVRFPVKASYVPEQIQNELSRVIS